MKQSQAYAAKRLITAAVTLGILLASLGFSGIITVPLAEGAAARVYFQAASPDKSGYAIDEAVNINVKYKWEGLTANTTVTLQLWNATNLMEALGTYIAIYNVGTTLTPSGTETVQYAPTVELTEDTGTKSYSLKMLSGGIVVDTASIAIVVAAGQVTMSITWQDQNNDRVVDVNELVTFTAYVNWAFVETTEAHSLYVNYGDGEKLLSSISVTSGSGSQTVTDSHGFGSTGAKTVTFTLKDATGTVVKTSAAAISVGAAAPTPAAPAQTSIVGLITANWQILAILVAVGVVGYVYLGDGKKRGK
ncbi:MAG: hypothetical protein ABIJ47_10915 [Candidatus Bathyarchaeota archaeon]